MPCWRISETWSRSTGGETAGFLFDNQYINLYRIIVIVGANLCVCLVGAQVRPYGSFELNQTAGLLPSRQRRTESFERYPRVEFESLFAHLFGLFMLPKSIEGQ